MTLIEFMETKSDFSPINTKWIFQKLVDMYGEDMSAIGITHGQGAEESQENDTTLDLMFIYERGYKNVSKLFKNFFTDDPSSMTKQQFTAKMKFFCQVIHTKYYQNWKRIYTALVSSEYNPIENYSSNETETRNTFDTQTSNVNNKITNTTTSERNAFNTTNLKTEGKTTTSSEGLSTDNVSTLNTAQGGTITHVKHGNIGVMTNQSMIEAELSLRAKSQFINLIFDDIDNYLLLQI